MQCAALQPSGQEGEAAAVRHGFTTGSCAAAAAKAASHMLLTGETLSEVSITTPKGLVYTAELEQIIRTENSVICGVQKDGGDDPDVTTGLIVLAEVSFDTRSGSAGGKSTDNSAGDDRKEQAGKTERVFIDGGKGVGRVTMPGLDQPVGNAAINSVPREMIRREVESILEKTGMDCRLRVIISIPGGEEVAARTFNPRLGITGGLSVLGTSGVVEPMSAQALLDTIRVELRQKKALGAPVAAMTPGNYGLDFMKQTYGFDLDQSVKCSNFIGASVDMAAELGFSKILLTGHIGKMIKVSGGIMNTHSHEADCRMELLAAAGLRAGADPDVLRELLGAATTDEAVRILTEKGCLHAVMEQVMDRIRFYLQARCGGKLQTECIVYSSVEGLLGMTGGAMDLLEEIRGFYASSQR